MSQEVKHRGSLISVPLALKVVYVTLLDFLPLLEAQRHLHLECFYFLELQLRV